MSTECFRILIESDFIKLFTMLLAVFAIVALLLYFKPQENNTRRFHIWYICGIATFIIIELVTWISVGNPNSDEILQSVSFAATLASLILSVLAIFITVISNDSLVRVKDSLNDIPNKVESTVDKSLSKLKEISNELGQNAKHSQEAQYETEKKITEMLNKLQGHIDEQFKEHNEKFNDISKKIDQTFPKQESMQTSESNIKPSIDNLILQYYVENTSLLALQMAFVVNMYVEKKASNPLSISEMLRILGYSTGQELVMYMFGIAVMLSSFDLIKYRLVKEGDYNNLIFSDISPEFSKLNNERLEKIPDAQKKLCNIEAYILDLVSNDSEEEPEDS